MKPSSSAATRAHFAPPTIGILAALLSACSSTAPGAEVSETDTRPSRTFRFVYEAAVAELPEEAETVDLWLPIPIDTPDQTIRDVTITSNVGHGTVRDIEGGFGRSVHFRSDGEPIAAHVEYVVTRYETTGGGTASRAELEKALAPSAMIPLEGKVATMAASLKTSGSLREQARELYDHTLERMRYDKPAGEAWGRGDAEWACDSRFGNCTDFHSYFMGLARKKGIPARFVMGFPIPDGDEETAPVGGYHCWAYFWTEEDGWVPVDISEADKHPERAEYFFGTLDANRFAVTGGRDLLLDPPPAQGRLNFFVYPYAEVDGETWAKIERELTRTNL